MKKRGGLKRKKPKSNGEERNKDKHLELIWSGTATAWFLSGTLL